MSSTPRPSWDGYFMDIAEAASARATCPRASVGAVLVSHDNRIVATGYNGAPAGLPHCDHEDDRMLRDGRCANAQHAERNLFDYAPWSLRPTRTRTLYVTHHPCGACLRVALQRRWGIARIVWRTPYRLAEVDAELLDYAVSVVRYHS